MNLDPRIFHTVQPQKRYARLFEKLGNRPGVPSCGMCGTDLLDFPDMRRQVGTRLVCETCFKSPRKVVVRFDVGDRVEIHDEAQRRILSASACKLGDSGVIKELRDGGTPYGTLYLILFDNGNVYELTASCLTLEVPF